MPTMVCFRTTSSRALTVARRNGHYFSGKRTRSHGLYPSLAINRLYTLILGQPPRATKSQKISLFLNALWDGYPRSITCIPLPNRKWRFTASSLSSYSDATRGTRCLARASGAGTCLRLTKPSFARRTNNLTMPCKWSMSCRGPYRQAKAWQETQALRHHRARSGLNT